MLIAIVYTEFIIEKVQYRLKTIAALVHFCNFFYKVDNGGIGLGEAGGHVT